MLALSALWRSNSYLPGSFWVLQEANIRVNVQKIDLGRLPWWLSSNTPARAGDMDSIPCLGRSHMPQGNQARDPQLLSSHAATTEASCPRVCALQQEKPLQLEAHTSQGRAAPLTETRESSCSNEDPAQP